MKKIVLLMLVSILATISTGCSEPGETVIPDRENLSTEIVEEFEFPSHDK